VHKVIDDLVLIILMASTRNHIAWWILHQMSSLQIKKNHMQIWSRLTFVLQ